MWFLRNRATRRPVRRGPVRPGVEVLEDRLNPVNLRLTGALTVDAFNVPEPNPVYGQMVYVRATWASENMVGGETCTVRYTLNGYPVDSGAVTHTPGNGSWYWYRGGWYAGTGSFTVTVTVDPDNLIAETDESDNSLTFTVTPVAPTDLPSKFLTPMGLTPNKDWAVTNYADVDPRARFGADYRGGPYQYDGHDAIDAGPVDFARQDSGMPVFAAADGTVVEVEDGDFDRETTMGNRPGNHVRIAHGNNWETLYYHFARDSIAVKVGDVVKAGQLLGLMGSSGSSTGTHLHYTAYYRGCQVEAGFSPSSYWVNPLPYAGDVPPFYLDAGLTNYDPSNDLQERPSQIYQFGANDPGNQLLYFYVQPYNIRTTDVMNWTWIQPNGSVQSSSFSPSGNFIYSTWWWFRSLGSFATAAGTWQVVFNLNGVEQRRLSFTVVNTPGAASIKVVDPSGRIVLDGRTTPVDFGTVAQGGTPPQQSFSVQNHGNGTLTLAGYTLPPGFSLVSAPSSLAAGASGTITVRLDSAVVGTKFGTLRVTTNDPDIGVFDFNLAGTVSGTAPFGAPVIDLDGSPSVTQNPATVFNFQSLPRPLAPAATVTDVDSPNFNGGTLIVEPASFGTNNDRLGVRNQGTAAGQIGVSGTDVTYGGTVIGTFMAGVGPTIVAVGLNGNATVAAVQALVRNVTYQNVGTTPTTQRKAVRFTLTDGTGFTSNLAVQHVVNSGVAKNPTVAALPARTVVRGTSLGYTGSFTDPNAFAWTATVDYGDGSGVQPLTLNADKTFNLARLYTAPAGVYTVTVTVTSDIGGTATATLPVTVVAPVGVSSVVVNAGQVQRSQVTEIVVTFSGLVTLPSTPGTAFELVGPNGAVTILVDLSLSTPTQTIVKLTFTGGGTEFGSLADGRYTLRVKADLIHDGYGAPVDGNGDGLAGGDNLFSLHRLFGDGNGDAVVDVDDLLAFAAAYGTGSGADGYVPWFDSNGDGVIDVDDLLAFADRYGSGV
jgi:murein DD-endopeptidase MepM/ murein hydrolase activator NlpD